MKRENCRNHRTGQSRRRSDSSYSHYSHYGSYRRCPAVRPALPEEESWVKGWLDAALCLATLACCAAFGAGLVLM